MNQLVLIAHNLRSCHNVGSLLRSADGLGVQTVYLTGYTPYPAGGTNDPRLPHLAAKLNRQISKTALGAQASINWQHHDDIFEVIKNLQQSAFTVAALEQAENAVALETYQPAPKLALIVGREIGGIEPAVLAASDIILAIAMLGSKQSFNVAVAAAMALYRLRFF
ncbi:MAG: TrmH family RNA methyltransferase [Candidatus Saccharimonadales bacterium]